MPDIEVAHGLRAMEQLRPEWNALFEALPRRIHAQSFGWVAQQIRWLEMDPESVYVAVARHAGKVVAVVPLRYAPRRLGAIKAACWSLLWDPHSTLSPILLAPQVDMAQVMDGIMAALLRSRQGCDQIVLPSVLDDGSWQGDWSARNRRVVANTCRQSMGFSTASANSALASSSSHFRKNLARQRRKLETLGAVELELAVEPDAALTAYEVFLDLEASGWKGVRGTGSAIRLDARLVNFYSGLIRSLHPRQEVWIATLRLDGRPVASNFCVRTDTTLAVLKISFDETLRQAAPGNVLLAMLLEFCAAHPEITWVSLVTGPAWAERWRPQEVRVQGLALFAPTLRGRAMYAFTRGKRALGRLHRDHSRVASQA